MRAGRLSLVAGSVGAALVVLRIVPGQSGQAWGAAFVTLVLGWSASLSIPRGHRVVGALVLAGVLAHLDVFSDDELRESWASARAVLAIASAFGLSALSARFLVGAGAVRSVGRRASAVARAARAAAKARQPRQLLGDVLAIVGGALVLIVVSALGFVGVVLAVDAAQFGLAKTVDPYESAGAIVPEDSASPPDVDRRLANDIARLVESGWPAVEVTFPPSGLAIVETDAEAAALEHWVTDASIVQQTERVRGVGALERAMLPLRADGLPERRAAALAAAMIAIAALTRRDDEVLTLAVFVVAGSIAVMAARGNWWSAGLTPVDAFIRLTGLLLAIRVVARSTTSSGVASETGDP